MIVDYRGLTWINVDYMEYFGLVIYGGFTWLTWIMQERCLGYRGLSWIIVSNVDDLGYSRMVVD